ncbi:unnamed protein product, partial [Heterosigma akashiwo]
FAAVFEKFVEENAHTIDLDSDENKLEYTDLYNEYQKLFESQLEGFIESQGSSVLEFYSEVRKANEEDPDSATAVLGRIMASTCDFDVFLYMMKEEKERQVRDDPEFQAKAAQVMSPLLNVYMSRKFGIMTMIKTKKKNSSTKQLNSNN